MKPQPNPATEKISYLVKMLAIAQSEDWVVSVRCILSTIEDVKNRTF